MGSFNKNPIDSPFDKFDHEMGEISRINNILYMFNITIFAEYIAVHDI